MSIQLSQIENVTNVKVSPNEYLVNNTILRNLQKLIENDKNLQKIQTEVLNNTNITLYNENMIYNINDYVWFLNTQKNQVLLLKSIINNNSNKPNKNNLSYYDNGWQNLSEDINIESTDIYNRLEREIHQYLQSHIREKHNKYGAISNVNIDDKIMKSDWSNRNLNRSNFQFPYTTGFLPQNINDNVILNGSYRLYDCGLIEYDIVYRFGYSGTTKHDGYTMDQIICNNLKIEKNETNSKYFLDDAYNIFNNVNESEQNFSLIGKTIQKNRNDFCNVYCAEIKFPVEFRDLNYMIFNTPILSQTTDKTHISNGANAITFTNKNKKSVTAVLITYPNNTHSEIGGYNTQNGGLAANSFRCKIVGKTVII